MVAQNPSWGIWEHEVAGSNPVAPTKDYEELRVRRTEEGPRAPDEATGRRIFLEGIGVSVGIADNEVVTVGDDRVLDGCLARFEKRKLADERPITLPEREQIHLPRRVVDDDYMIVPAE